ncbi:MULTISPECIES: helix-turn-helix domain-containing protein [Anaerostipes]|uniref:helix-turn-helix domain-containing protein n=1 Tax=Anaerostipes TaxID=207244 RepID=UPI0009530641|nr:MULTISPECIES: helix-turn-helix transcriptional regulator [Anaerostipes]MCI5623668.1 helix-turn-helix domain-containing protein [Anaerostipes sp.]MDY2727294.1 helix-turn-helix transcriptional regulator [Anaerostipes faecalis]OLR59130.1 DNA-binding protein [Anaerostipes sp. 494a]
MEIDYKALGARIREIRQKKGLTQEYVAEKAEISVTHMSNIENASKTLSLKLLVIIAGVLEVTVDQLLVDSYPREKRQDVFFKEMEVMLEQCNAGERRVVINTVTSLVDSLLEKRKNQD